MDITELKFADLYYHIGQYHKNFTFTQFNTLFDNTQVGFFLAMGGADAETWSKQMRASLDDIKGRTENFRTFLADGKQHCVIPYNAFFTTEANGIKLTDWLTQFVEDKPIENVFCSNCK